MLKVPVGTIVYDDGYGREGSRLLAVPTKAW